MNPQRIAATHYRTFERLDVELPTGCVAVVGPNGAGKSSLINAIDVALFADRGELPGLLSLGEDELVLELDFEHGGELYRVRRMYSDKGRGKTTLDLEATDGPLGEWRPLTRETAAATQEHLEEILGLSRATFRASSFLAQGDGAAFTEASPRDRKAILAEILGLDVWDRLLGRARTELRGCEDGILVARGAISSLEEIVAGKEAAAVTAREAAGQVAETQATVDDAVRQLEEAQAAVAANAAAVEAVRACEAELATARATLKQAQAALNDAEAAASAVGDKTIELDDLTADADRVDELERQVRELLDAAAAAREARARRDALAAQVAQRDVAHARMVDQARQLRDAASLARGNADHLDAHIDESAVCDRCHQTLGAEAAARAAASYRAEADEADARADHIDAGCTEDLAEIGRLRGQLEAIIVPETLANPEPLERELAVCRTAAERRGAVAEQLRHLTDVAARRDELAVNVRDASAAVDGRQLHLEAARAVAADNDVLVAKAGRWRVAAEEARRLLDIRKAAAVRAEEQLARIADAEESLAVRRAEIASVQDRIDVLKLAERAYGRDGIPALIVENAAIPQIELEANRILGEFGGATADCRIELRTQRALKSSDALRETLDIVIRTPAGDRPYETFSGGERTRLNLALRIALARLLAHRRGAESRLLAIDEPDGLDAAGMERLAVLLVGMADTFDRILVVSHNSTLSTAFDQTIEVVKDGDRSRIGEAAAEAVAA